MTPLTDTSPEAERVLRDVLRRMPFERRWAQMGEMWRTARTFHAMGYRDRHPDATRQDINCDWILQTVGDIVPRSAWRQGMADSLELPEAVVEVFAALDALRIPYALGGSWASSLLGKLRFTQDADLTTAPFAGREAEFCDRLQDRFYVAVQAVRDAVRRRASFNLIHFDTSYKIDIFVCKDRPFDITAFGRRALRRLPNDKNQECFTLTPEDVILFKMQWYRLGGEASEQQWSDILGVFAVRSQEMDSAYLDHWAADLGVSDLLARARQQSHLP